MFKAKADLRSHLINDCPDQKLKCSECSKQVSKGSKARHICVQGHQRLMKANKRVFKRQLKAKDAKIAAAGKLVAKTVTELHELTTSAEESKHDSKPESDKSKKQMTRELRIL